MPMKRVTPPPQFRDEPTKAADNNIQHEGLHGAEGLYKIQALIELMANRAQTNENPEYLLRCVGLDSQQLQNLNSNMLLPQLLQYCLNQQRHNGFNEYAPRANVDTSKPGCSTDSTFVDHSLGSSRSRGPSPPNVMLDQEGRYNVSKLDVMSEEIWDFHNSVAQTDTTLNRKLYLRDLLYYAICPIFPLCGLYVVGSSLNGFGNNSSDMDICLMVTNQELDQRHDAIVILNMVFQTLCKVEWVNAQTLISAKVPILRITFTAPYSDIVVDLNVNNSVAIRNTHLLCYYSSFDWRVRPLVSMVKEWAKKKGINDASRSSFTSYSLVLMTIHYLQVGAKPVILPSLQEKIPKRFGNDADVRSLNVSQPLPNVDVDDGTNTETLGALLLGFFNYYTNDFDFNEDAISVRLGKKVSRMEVVSAPASVNPHWKSQWRCCCIEEPFTGMNTAHSIYNEEVFSEIKMSFKEAYETLNETHDLSKLLTECKKINASQDLTSTGSTIVHYQKK